MEREEGHAGYWVRNRHLAGMGDGVEVCFGDTGKHLCVTMVEGERETGGG